MFFKGKKGTTLSEVIVAIMILGIILAPASLVFYSGYKNYFIENDKMLAQRSARQAMDGIIEDLRANENANTKVSVDGTTLTIKDDCIYKYSNTDKKLLKNDVSLFEDDEKVTSFVVKSVSDGYDTSVINIKLAIKVGRSDDVTLENSYRRKIR